MRITRPQLRAVATIAAVAAAAVLPVRAMAATGPVACTSKRVLVLTAMPLELNPIIARAHFNEVRVPVTGKNDRRFYVGALGDKDVVLAMTGIGLVNATETTEA